MITLSDYRREIPLPQVSGNFVSVAFLFMSILVLTIKNVMTSDSQINVLTSAMSILLVYFLPGWMVISTFITRLNETKILTFVLSFVLSIGLSSLIYLVANMILGNDTHLVLPLMYVAISLVPVVKMMYRSKAGFKLPLKRYKNYCLIGIITIAYILFFFIYTIIILYPQIAFVPGQDIIRHYSTVSTLLNSPDIFHSEYPWFHLSLAAYYQLSNSNLELFQTSTSFLSIVLIFSFYLLSKAYLKPINKNIHYIATLVFTVFSGFGWLYYFQQMPLGIIDKVKLYSSSYFASYFDIGVGQSTWLWMWFRPITVGFTLFFILLLLMRNTSLRRFSYVGICTFILITLSLVHFSEYAFFVAIIFIVSLVLPSTKFRTLDTSFSVLFSAGLSPLILLVHEYLIGSGSISSNIEYQLIIAFVAVLTILLTRFPKRPNLHLKFNYTLAAVLTLACYCSLLTYWYIHTDTVKDRVIEIVRDITFGYAVPIVFYPVLLGIMGLLSILGSFYLYNKFRRNPVIIFPLILVSVIIISKIITLINLQFADLGYWERRLIPYLWMSVSLISSVALLKIVNSVSRYFLLNSHLTRYRGIMVTILLSGIIFMGTLSTIFTLDYQKLITINNSLDPTDRESIATMMKSEPRSTILTVSSKSQHLSEYANFNYIVGYYKFQIWPSVSPELPLYLLSSLNNSAYIYTNNDDLNQIVKNGYQNGYIYSHIMNTGTSNRVSNGSDILTLIPRMAPPTSFSDLIIAQTYPLTLHDLYLYDIFSYGKYNFTTADINDISILKGANTIVVSNVDAANLIEDYRKKYDLGFRYLLILDVKSDLGSSQNTIPLRNLDILYNPKENNIGPSLPYNKVYIKSYDPPIDLSHFSSFGIEFNGKNSTFTYSIKFESSADRFIEYKFNDTWNGPQKILFPIKMLDARSHYNFNGVNIEVVNSKTIDWNNISKIAINSYEPDMPENNMISFNAFLYNIHRDLMNNISLINSDQTDKFPVTNNLFIPLYDNIYYLGNLINKGKFFQDVDSKSHHSVFPQKAGYKKIYVNLSPLIENFEMRHISYPLYSHSFNLSRILDSPLPDYKFGGHDPSQLVSGRVSAFDKLDLNGNVSISSPSIEILSNGTQFLVDIDGKFYRINNVTQIDSIQSDFGSVFSKKAVVSGLSGFYSSIYLPNKSITKFDGEKVILSIKKTDNSEILIEGKNITIFADNIHVKSRQPSIVNQGLSKISNFYSYGDLNRQLGILGKDVELEGRLSMQIKFSDHSSIGMNTSYHGKDFKKTNYYYATIENLDMLNKFDSIYIMSIFGTGLLIYFIISRIRRIQK